MQVHEFSGYTLQGAGLTFDCAKLFNIQQCLFLKCVMQKNPKTNQQQPAKQLQTKSATTTTKHLKQTTFFVYTFCFSSSSSWSQREGPHFFSPLDILCFRGFKGWMLPKCIVFVFLLLTVIQVKFWQSKN